MQKVFLDIGGHAGESAEAALHYDFDRVYSFEPSAEARERWHLTDPRLRLLPFGLYSTAGEMKLYHGSQSESSSVHVDKRGVDPDKYEVCRFERISDWMLENVEPDAFLVGKINVEGAEIELLKDLESRDLISRFSMLVVYPDFRKVSSLAKDGRKYFDEVLDRHKNVRISISVLRADGKTSIVDRTIEWLGTFPELRRSAELPS